jgi:hypothetical protein
MTSQEDNWKSNGVRVIPVIRWIRTLRKRLE